MPILGGEFIIVKLLAILAYCLNITIMENKFLVNYLNNLKWYHIEIKDLYVLVVKIFILMFMIEELINKLIDSDDDLSIKAKSNINKLVKDNNNNKKSINNNK